MRFRLGLVIGFGAGYYLGAKAGRERYEQLDRWLEKARNSEVVETAAEKAKAVVDLGVERAKDLIEHDEVDPARTAAVVGSPVNGDSAAAVNSGLPIDESAPPSPS
jgi:hypothetical protein